MNSHGIVCETITNNITFLCLHCTIFPKAIKASHCRAVVNISDQ